MRIAGRNLKRANIFSLVYDWLRNEGNGKWVLILDNADDKDVFTNQAPNDTSADPKQLCDFLPQSTNGSILVTSRSRDAAFQITCNYKTITSVEQMTEAEALTLLDSHLQDSHSDDDKKLLVETLGYVPLAVSQAAANISRRSLPIPAYLEELRKNSEASASLLDDSLPQLHRESSRSNSIVATWKVTFEYVRRTTPSAARLLSLMCLFDRQDIPETLLKGKYGEEVTMPPLRARKPWWRRRPRARRRKEKPVPAKIMPVDFEDDWLVLRDFSLIALNRDRRHFSMHPIVQYTTRKWLSLHEELDAWKQQCVSIMDLIYPASAADKNLCLSLLPHAFAAIVYRPSDTDIQPLHTWASLTNKAGQYQDQVFNQDLAQKLYRVSVEAYQTCLGASAPCVLKLNTQRACILNSLGRHTEAESLQRRVLSLRSATLGPEHPDTLNSTEDLASLLAHQDRFKEAETLYLKTLEIRSRTLGDRHADTQDSLSNLAFFYFRHGRLNDAYEASHRGHVIRAKADVSELKADDKWCADLTRIALSHMIGGALSSAENRLREALTECEKGANDNNTSLTEILVPLARSLAQQEKNTESAPLFQRAVDLFAPSQKQERLAAMAELAYVLFKLDSLDEAHDVATGCLAGLTDLNGAKDRDAYEVTWVLASTLEKKGKWDEAVVFFRKAYVGTRDLLGEAHVDTVDFRRDYEQLMEKIEQKKEDREVEVDDHRCDEVALDCGIKDQGSRSSEEDTVAGAEEVDENVIQAGQEAICVVRQDLVVAEMTIPMTIAAG